MKPRILAITGSLRPDSSNQKIVKKLEELLHPDFTFSYFNGLTNLPYFIPDQAFENTPEKMRLFREEIQYADIVLICTPEYIFSIPGVLKNALEWFVATDIFNQKPVVLITASASGEKGQKELHLIMKTLGAKFSEESTLLIPGVKGRFNTDGQLTDPDTIKALQKLSENIRSML
ncbi:NAD(P)H-dependent oxidoreductase [Elizabethkingia anophelis]|uniref:NAD(P)H-dependent oxidoreductase n=1 Tax=Elizabethkingia anophelis R26 TaxID=1246994 RepID=A0ABN5BYD8_9FLAO|nr:NADPH-dependent FMN reductase [Elizabethkingia anophelis]ATC36736.1 NAD(P)H-dependent oxidoreductase [Elizabethkingia anophelis R26]ATC40413.1 NAD(P)H-dependent oxidoreductase [Elizabethkingia anophelis Ag1]ATC44091.1 NAD(P)H-dependent oxidoreductase [Elizabethkingia anophelis]ATC47767.1 NAD(P)H-dependent oxidoreductase [Elizabethkingia anophelis]ELR79694.1 NADPH-dependent FMN reductase [Elizabethkingia anophelis R26]